MVPNPIFNIDAFRGKDGKACVGFYRDGGLRNYINPAPHLIDLLGEVLAKLVRQGLAYTVPWQTGGYIGWSCRLETLEQDS